MFVRVTGILGKKDVIFGPLYYRVGDTYPFREEWFDDMFVESDGTVTYFRDKNRELCLQGGQPYIDGKHIAFDNAVLREHFNGILRLQFVNTLYEVPTWQITTENGTMPLLLDGTTVQEGPFLFERQESTLFISDPAETRIEMDLYSAYVRVIQKMPSSRLIFSPHDLFWMYHTHGIRLCLNP